MPWTEIFRFFYILGFVNAFFFGIIIFLFCAKCSTKNNCSHVYLGLLTKFLPDKSTQKYNSTDYFGTGIALAFITLIPQVWLWESKTLFVIYWLLSGIALWMINKHVCTSCDNTKCAMCKKTKTIGT